MSTSSVTNRPQTQVQTRSTPEGSRAPSNELKKGDSGAAVRQLQSNLVKLGFMTQHDMDTGPGRFGPRTEKALKAFQSAHHLASDSICGPQTHKALKSALNSGGTHGKGGDSFDPGSSGPSAQTKPPATPPATTTTTSSSAERPHPKGLLGKAYADNSKKAAEAKADPRYASELKEIANMSPEKRKLVDEVARKADLPPALVAGIWYREGSLKNNVYLHNGDPLGKPTVNVPKGIFFRKDQFVEAAVDALKDKASTQKSLNLHYDSKDLGAMATYAEAYNGYGYRKNEHTSPYAFAGTNQYKGGLYVKDHQYSATTFDRRPGILAIAQEYMKH